MPDVVRNSTTREIRRWRDRMILANWPRRASEEPHSSTAPNRLVEAYFLPWSGSLSSDAPYWRPPSRDAQYGLSVGVMVSKSVYVPPSGIVGAKGCSRQLSVALSGRLRCGLIP